MQRIKITLSYDGNFFSGFQRQKDNTKHRTVAGTIEEALKHLNIHTSITGAGRTDAGVHAFGQVAHLDIPSFWSDREKLLYHLNASLHPHIHIKQIIPVSDDFHARFSAQKRLYRYVLYDGAYQPFLSHYALHVKPIESKKIDTYAKLFEGFHNFSFFKKEGGGKTKEERTIFKAGAYRYNNVIVIYFLGDAFLRSQVRMMCHMILKVYEGVLRPEDIIEQRDKQAKHSSTLAPACGLYLSRIYY